ncbi:hypothetical protein FRB96_003906 [Tulasnella sp. 330]|nr:hypothetical protein FRB96_003906 [Tulasnella sp. 330]
MRIEEELLGYAYLTKDLKKNAAPKTLKEAMESEDWKNWKEVMDVEMAQLDKMGTWELMELPAGWTAIGCRWHMIFALATIYCYNIQQMDIKTAYLYGELEEEIYMRQPEGYNDGTGRDDIHCDFVTVWVNDLTAISKDTTTTPAIKYDISTKFELKDLRSLTLLIGIQISGSPCEQLLTMS